MNHAELHKVAARLTIAVTQNLDFDEAENAEELSFAIVELHEAIYTRLLDSGTVSDILNREDDD